MHIIQIHRPTQIVLALAVVAATASGAFAQSGSRSGAGSAPAASGNRGDSSPAGSTSRETQSEVGLRGYCPVCLVEVRDWIKGDPRLAIEFDGKKYLFPGAEQAEMFENEPLKYVPVLGGDDIVLFARTGKRVEGELNFGVVHKGRIYFFAAEENKQLFQASPESYENADLALGGECIVCRVDMNQQIPGNPKFTTLYHGIRYQFPGEEQQRAFLMSPARYVEALPAPPGQTPAGSGTRSSAPPRQPAGASGTR